MEKTALLVIDVQHEMVMDNPYAIHEVIGNIQKLLAACRESGIEVIYVQHNGTDGGDLVPGSVGWEIYSEIAPLPGEMVFTKNFNSAFRGTPLKKYLEDKGIMQLIITGMQTEYCIDTTVKVAFEYGYKLILPDKTNTTFDGSRMSGQQLYEFYNYNIFSGRFGIVEAVEETLKRIAE